VTQLELWKTTAKRYVAFLDIMGFKDRVFRETHEDVLKFMERMSSYIKSIESHAMKKIIEQNKGVTRPVFFSDSILLVTNNDSEDSLESIITACGYLIWNCLRMGIPLKGAISHGMQTADFDQSLHIGKALIDAYLLQNDIFFYGVVFHHTMEQKLQDILTHRENIEVVLYDTPFKKVGKIKHYVIDWTIADDFEQNPGMPKSLDIANKLYSTVSGEPRKYVDNTVEFVKAMNSSEKKTHFSPPR
jgi:hypothetical protein